MKDPMEPQLSNIINTMNDGLVMVNPDGTIGMVNDALTRMLGYKREELEGQPCTIMDCDVCEASRGKGGELWCGLFQGHRVSRKLCHVRRKDGSYLQVLKNASVLREGDRIQGAVETLTDVSELERKDETIRELRRILGTENSFHGFIGQSQVMLKTYDLLEKAARSDAPVIIYGESGTGKELAAHAIHEMGSRSGGPFIQCNCAALNESLLESELFGHTKGAFTGAVSHRMGRFEAAHNGDVFLDEIGDVPLSIQVKLLRVLETKRIERVGDHRPIDVDVRFITATNRNLQQLVESGEFREDFFFRINVIPIILPPLRDRRDDIPLLVDHFLKSKERGEPQSVSPEAMRVLVEYSWPGNVRELKSALEYAHVIRDSGPVLPEHLPPQVTAGMIAGQEQDKTAECMAEPYEPQTPDRDTGMARQKRELVDALRRTGGNKSAAARILGVTRMTVLNRMRKYGVFSETVISG